MSSANVKPIRNPSLDVLRITAFFLVVSVHFFSLSKYKSMVVGGPMMLLMSMAYSVAICCVPLFIMLTGYLQTNKTLSKKYYLGITRPAATYILASAACLIFVIPMLILYMILQRKFVMQALKKLTLMKT